MERETVVSRIADDHLDDVLSIMSPVIMAQVLTLTLTLTLTLIGR